MESVVATSPVPQPSWEQFWNERNAVRICHMQSTSVLATAVSSLEASDSHEVMDLGRMAPFAAQDGEFLPRLLKTWNLAPEHLTPERFILTAEQQLQVKASAWSVPGGFLQLMVTVDLAAEDVSVIGLLEDLHLGRLLSKELLQGLLAQVCPETLGSQSVDQESHQMVFFPSDWEADWDRVQRIVYRADLAADPKHAQISFPGELNRRFGKGCALSPFVSAFWGQQEYIENCAMLSALQNVSAWARIRQIRRVTHQEFLRVQKLVTSAEGSQYSQERRRGVRQTLIAAQETISELEGRLTFGVDSARSILFVLPSMRAEAYHSGLFTALGLAQQSEIAEIMLRRLTSAVASETLALATVEEHLAEQRRRRWAVSIGLLSTLAIPLSILLGFFSVGTSDVNNAASLFDYRQFGVFYLITLGIVALSLATHFAMLVRSRRQLPRSRRDAGPPLDGPGLL